MDSELVATARFVFGETRGEVATVPAALVDGLNGERAGYAFCLSAPDTREHSGFHFASEDVMWCGEFAVEARKMGDRADLDVDEAWTVTGQIARDALTCLVLNAPNLGFPGAMPRRESASVTIDGERVAADPRNYFDPNSVILLADDVVAVGDLRRAAEGVRPSTARVLVAEAGYQALFNPKASKTTAVIVAASGCEVAIHTCARRLASGHTEKLVNALLPKDEQARMAPVTMVDAVLPVLSGKRLADVDSLLWGDLRKLFKARNRAVHAVVVPDAGEAERLVYQARRIVEWVESLEPAS